MRRDWHSDVYLVHRLLSGNAVIEHHSIASKYSFEFLKMLMNYALFLFVDIVLETLPNERNPSIGAIRSSDIGDGYMGLCTPPNSKRRVQASSGVDSEELPYR